MTERRETLPQGKLLGCFLIVLLGVLAFVVRGYHDERHVLQFRDFKQPYASARCLLHDCNPYSEADTRAEFLRAGGTDKDSQVFRPYSALYPPFSFAVLAPVAALDYRAAHLVWFWTIAALFSVATLLIADLCFRFGTGLAPPLLLALFTASSTILLMLGQISGPVIALVVIAFWCLLRERALWLAVAAFTLALALKPHDSALLCGYLLFAGPRWRKAFLLIALLTAAVVVGGTLWCAHQPASAHWLGDLRANLQGNAGAGGANDPTRGSIEAPNMANLQPLFAAETSHARVYNLAAELASLVLLGAWAVPAWRMRNSVEKHTLAVAAMSCLMLLPIYHRQYDTRALLLVFPATALLLAWRPRSWGVASLLLLAVATALTSHTYLNRPYLRQTPQIETAGGLKTILFYRPLPLVELAIAIFLIAAFHAYARSKEAAGLAERTPAQPYRYVRWMVSSSPKAFTKSSELTLDPATSVHSGSGNS